MANEMAGNGRYYVADENLQLRHGDVRDTDTRAETAAALQGKRRIEAVWQDLSVAFSVARTPDKRCGPESCNPWSKHRRCTDAWQGTSCPIFC